VSIHNNKHALKQTHAFVKRANVHNRDWTVQMPDENTNRSRSAKPSDGDGEETLSPLAILVILVTIALVCVGGYFLLMKLIDVSQQEDCVLAGRRNCAPIEVPSSR
jgi:hypothetical protein